MFHFVDKKTGTVAASKTLSAPRRCCLTLAPLHRQIDQWDLCVREREEKRVSQQEKEGIVRQNGQQFKGGVVDGRHYLRRSMYVQI